MKQRLVFFNPRVVVGMLVQVLGCVMTDVDAERLSEDVAQLFLGMSDGDRSVIATAVTTEGAMLMTGRGSDNDRFCELLERVGWTAEAQVPDDIEEAARDDVICWDITDAGRKALADCVPVPA